MKTTYNVNFKIRSTEIENHWRAHTRDHVVHSFNLCSLQQWQLRRSHKRCDELFQWLWCWWYACIQTSLTNQETLTQLMHDVVAYSERICHVLRAPSDTLQFQFKKCAWMMHECDPIRQTCNRPSSGLRHKRKTEIKIKHTGEQYNEQIIINKMPKEMDV